MKLLITKANQLGDNAVFLPVLQQFLTKLPGKNVHLLTTPAAADLYDGLIPRENLWLESRDEVLNAWKRPVRFLRLLKRWSRISPEAVLLPFDQGNVPRLLARLTGTPVRVGAVNPGLYTNRLLTSGVSQDPDQSVAESEWLAGRKLARVIGFETVENPWPEHPPAPRLMHLTGDVIRNPDRILIHPSASHPVKCWPMSRYVELANRLAERHAVSWQVTDAPEEAGLRRRIERIEPGPVRVFVRKLAGSGLFIGNNSGPMNLAVATATPTLIFAGPAPPQWDPFWHREQNVILRSPGLSCQPCATVADGVTRCDNHREPHACMSRWTVDHVERLVEGLRQRCLGRLRKLACT